MTLKTKVLIVEDAKIAQKVAQRVLEHLDCDVNVAEDGMQALQLANKTQYDLIFMDLGLPNNFDGFQVTEAIRLIDGYQTVFIVALTAHVEDSYKERAAKVGMDDFLIKPLSEEKAKAILEKFIFAKSQNNQVIPGYNAACEMRGN